MATSFQLVTIFFFFALSRPFRSFFLLERFALKSCASHIPFFCAFYCVWFFSFYCARFGIVEKEEEEEGGGCKSFGRSWETGTDAISCSFIPSACCRANGLILYCHRVSLALPHDSPVSLSSVIFHGVREKESGNGERCNLFGNERPTDDVGFFPPSPSRSAGSISIFQDPSKRQKLWNSCYRLRDLIYNRPRRTMSMFFPRFQVSIFRLVPVQLTTATRRRN